ncbi:hypothetical protein IMZ48_07535 [Candidatus Bathyarchaeota archaeon]|nr:hypothetical protein [Candidatus Bathyarchaeota archaeon]
MSPQASKVTKTTPEKPAKRSSGKTSLQTDEAVYFWREVDPDFGFLSQWYHCPFTDPEDPSIVYPTAEQ